MTARLREDARAAWDAGLRAVSPELCVSRALASRPDVDPLAETTLTVAVGKAAARSMRGALHKMRGALGPAAPHAMREPRAIVLVPAGCEVGELPRGVLVLRGGHPHPTPDGIEATRRIMEEAGRLERGERLLFLLSGGASALLEAPAAGLTSKDLVLSHRALVTSGLAIASINLVRGCLSAVKAGRLAELAAPAAVTTLAISDVEGDDPVTIGSGPTVMPRASHAAACRAALEVLRNSTIALPDAALQLLEQSAAADGAAARGGEATRADFTVVASVSDAVAAASAELAARGYRMDAGHGARAYLGGPTSAAAVIISNAIATLPTGSEPSCVRCAAVFGGETTVAVTSARPGRGGRSLDLAARIALAVAGRQGAAVLCAGTDGIDGSSRAAGAVIDGTTAARAEHAGFPLARALDTFDTERALEAAGDLVMTGPTGTNVGDLVVALAGF